MTTKDQPPFARRLTPAGVGAISVIRLSGFNAGTVWKRVFRPFALTAVSEAPLGRLLYGRWVDPFADDEMIDDGMSVVCRRSDTHSTIDLCVHGGLRIVERLLSALKQCGARVDEGVHAVDSDGFDVQMNRAFSRAKTRRAVRFIARQRVLLAKELAAIAAQRASAPHEAKKRLAELIARSRPASLLIDGAVIAVVGPPNAGKSTLVNRLFDGSGSLVSEQPGTTRDWVKTETAIDGVPIQVIDTAGVRDVGEALETDAIKRGLAMAREADIQLLVVDLSRSFPADIESCLHDAIDRSRVLVIANKSDLTPAWDPSVDRVIGRAAIGVSAITGHGIDELRRNIVNHMGIENIRDNAPVLLGSEQITRADRLVSDVGLRRWPVFLQNR